MTLEQLAAKLKSAQSMFSLASLSPQDMASAFEDAENRAKALEARVTKLEQAQKS